MPIAYIDTSLRDKAISDDFEKKFSAEIGRVLNKPIERIRVILRTGERIMDGGEKDSPACIVQIYSIGVFDMERNPGYTTAFLEFLSKELKLETDRILLMYLPIEGYMAGSGRK